MALKTFLYLLAVFIWLSDAYLARADEQEKMNLVVGEIRTIKIEKAIKVHVSRKGIIHLIHDHEDIWQMTALRSGMVAIEVKATEQQSKTLYVQVRPPSPESKRPLIGNLTAGMPCLKNHAFQSIQYEVRTTVEMADATNATTTGSGLSAAINWTPSATSQSISFEATPQVLNNSRKIIGDPVITTNPCVDIEIRAGGEDQADIRSDSNVITSSWKPHGLAINMKVLPLSSVKVRIPYQVSLRIPSRKQGSYSVSEAQASMDLLIGLRKLAAVINLASSIDERKSPYLLSGVPIIGPLISGRSDSSSSSKLLVWIQVQRHENL